MSLATGIDCQGLLDLLEGGGGLSKVATIWLDSSCTVSIQGMVPAPVSTGSLHIIEQLVHEILACRVCADKYSNHDNASSCYSRTPGLCFLHGTSGHITLHVKLSQRRHIHESAITAIYH